MTRFERGRVETITKLFTGLVSVRVARDCDLGLENTAIFSRPRSKILASWQITYMYPKIKVNLCFPSTLTNKIHRFVKIPLFAVDQVNNFVMLWAGRTWQNFCLLCKKSVNECCRRVRPACFALTKFCPTLPNFKEAATRNWLAPWALRFFVRRFYRTFLFV